jgi:methionine-rich copper-binding protein CopC
MNSFSIGRTLPRMLGAAALLAAASVALVASPASAHAPLLSSDPADGSVVETLPSTVTFTFGEDVFTPAYVTVTDPDGISVSTGDPTIAGAVVTQQLRTDGAVDGTYTASYRVVSDDGHPVSKTIHFSVGAPSASVADSPGWWHDHWWYVLIAVVIVLGAGAVFARARTRKN